MSGVYANSVGSEDNIRQAMLSVPREWYQTDWYLEERQKIETVAAWYNLPVDTVTAVVAVLSPLRRWRFNIDDAIITIESWRRNVDPTDVKALGGWPAGKKNTVVRAYRILDTNDTSIVAGPKVTRFYRNLMGIDLNDVTVDSHAYHIWIGSWSKESVQFTETLYMLAQEAYQKIAEEFGMSAASLQALTWEYRREALRKNGLPQVQYPYPSGIRRGE